MKNFDQKWKECTRKLAPGEQRDERASAGFAARVVAQAFSREALSIDVLFECWARRWLMGMTAVLVLCAVFELRHLHDRHPFDTGIQNTVAQVVWSL